MSKEFNLEISEPRHQRQQEDGRSNHNSNGQTHGPGAQDRSGSGRRRPSGQPFVSTSGLYEPTSRPFNLWLFLEIVFRRWSWLLVAGAACGLVALLGGLKITKFTARVSLIRRENPNAFTAGSGENTAPQAYISRELSPQTLFGMMTSPEVFRRVSEKATPPVRPERLGRGVRVIPERNPDFVTLTLSGKEPKEVLAKWANVYADEVVAYTRELQADEAGSIADFLALKLKSLSSQLAHINENMARFSEKAQTLDLDKEVEKYAGEIVALETKADLARLDLETTDVRIRRYQLELAKQTPANDRLQAARDELGRLKTQYTELHPLVIRQKAIIAGLEKESAQPVAGPLESKVPGGSLANAIQLQIIELESNKLVRQRELQEYDAIKAKMQDKAKALSKTAVEYAQLKAGQRRLEDLRVTLLSKQEEAQLLRDNAMGYFKVFSYASPNDITGRKRLFIVGLLSAVGTLLGLLVAGVLALLAEAMDRRLKSAADLERATRLPVLATLGDLRKMTAEEQITWAFRTLTLLQGKLNSASDQTLVCGFVSSRHGEGRSTWIDLLVSAASQRGMRVLTVATRPSHGSDDVPEQNPKDLALLPVGPATTLTKNVLAYPAQVTEQFNDPKAQPIVHIPLPGWVWNLERRQQWRTALEHWEQIPNLVLLIELPPACQPESVLLAEHLPQVIWLAGSGQADIEETRAQLETLRHARCNLVGAVLNREPVTFFKRHLSAWLSRFGLLLLCSLVSARAAQSGSPPAQPAAAPEPVASSAPLGLGTPVQRAPWQERLTLGPGDAFDISVFSHPELTRTNLVVGPDGRVNFFQIENFPAAGLTIDELRNRLDTELSRFFVGGARTIVVPTTLASKKYFVLGKVVTEGVFILDRPLTVIEAVARAKGLQTGGAERSAGEVADLGRSFLSRQGKRVPVDFERLFHEGDLSQNVALEPNDYLYFAPAAPQEIYVLGEVLNPGRVGMSSQASLLTAIAARGGFTPNAYRKRVLVVRGSLQKPQAYAVDAPAMLAGRIPDFRLEAQDIVYVNARPWLRVEQLLDIAAQAFIESAVTFWVGDQLPAVFTSPILPRL